MEAISTGHPNWVSFHASSVNEAMKIQRKVNANQSDFLETAHESVDVPKAPFGDSGLHPNVSEN